MCVCVEVETVSSVYTTGSVDIVCWDVNVPVNV
jgi:hypothetical protein